MLPPERSDASPEPSGLPSIFLGDDGLRAGWSLLLFLVISLLLNLGFGAALTHLHLISRPVPGADITPSSTDLQDGMGFLLLGVSAWITGKIERRPFRRYGTPLRRALPDFAIGLVWGFTVLSVLAGALLLTHHLAWDGPALRGAAALVSAGKWALAFLCVGLFEEFLFRGFLQYTLARGLAGVMRALRPQSRHSYAVGFWGAALVFSGVLFAWTHTSNGGETALGIAAVALAGAVFAFSLWRTASLWWAIGFHAAWDWAQTFFYGTPDSGLHGVGHLFNTHPVGARALSGGSDGPEGSLFVVPALLLALLVIHLTLPFRPRALTPDQTPPELV